MHEIVLLLKRLRLYSPAIAVLQALHLRDWVRHMGTEMHADSPAQRQLYRESLAFYRPFIQPGDCCFDIGANIGDKVRVFQELGASVIALEPQDACMDILHRRFRRQLDIVLLQQAAGAEPGVKTMYLCDVPSRSTLSPEFVRTQREHLPQELGGWNALMEVDVTTLDRLIAQYGKPTFCKIDVEGFDAEVLLGLSQPLRFLSFEFQTSLPQETQRCIQRLSELGIYEFNYTLAEAMVFQLPCWVDGTKLLTTLATYPGGYGDVFARQCNPAEAPPSSSQAKPKAP